MRMTLRATAAAVAFALVMAPAQADVTLSKSNDPTAPIAGQMASLFGAEHDVVAALSGAKLKALATGPEAQAKAAVQKKSLKGKAPSLEAIRYDDEWLAQFPATSADAQWQCMQSALYHEARGESLKGQFAVAEVILNRRDSGRYPGSVCGVVRQSGGGGCQFSFVCDGYSDRMREQAAAARAGRIASAMLAGAPRSLTEGATHFHTRAVRPGWARKFPQTAAIGAHLFYRQP